MPRSERDAIQQEAWEQSYPSPMASCLMPFIAICAILLVGMTGFWLWQQTLPNNREVPDVVGKPQAEATRTLKRAGFAVEVVRNTQSSEELPAGTVYSTMPSGGCSVKEGRLVRMILSSGSAFTKIPEVRELTQGDAQKRLQDSGLTIGTVEYAFHETIPFDRVISITPPVETRVARDGSVAVVISKGPKPSSREVPLSDTRTISVSVRLPNDTPTPAEARIDVIDDDGKRTVYAEQHDPGDFLFETVSGNGKMTVLIYYDNRLVQTRKVN